MAAHAVSGDWKLAKKTALEARATAVREALDHLNDIEEMLEEDERYQASGSVSASSIPQDIRSLASRLRSLASDYESEAGRVA